MWPAWPQSYGCGHRLWAHTLTEGPHGYHGVGEDEPKPKLPDTDRFIGEVKGHVLADWLQRLRGRAEVRGSGTPLECPD